MNGHFKRAAIAHPGLDRYLLEHTTPEDPLLRDLFRETYVKVHHPRRSSDHLSGRFLEMVCRMMRPRKVLEIGTFTGYGALAMAGALDADAELHTIEVNDELEPMIREWINRSPAAGRIHLHIGNALEIVPRMDPLFDLVFIDGEKDQYVDYYEAAMAKTRSGCFILADNALWSGKVLEEDIPESDRFTRGVKRFNDHVQADPRVDNLLLPAFDGVMMIRVK